MRLAPWPAGTAAAYVKFGLHERPTLGVAVALADARRGRAGRVIATRAWPSAASARGPQRVAAAEARLRGVAIADARRRAPRAWRDGAAAAVDPADDLHGSADYKREMVARLRRAARCGSPRARARGASPSARAIPTPCVA